MRSRRNYAVTEILSLVFVLFIATGVISVTMLWGASYMDDKKASVRLEGALLQLNTMSDMMEDVLNQGINSTKVMNFKADSGDVYLDPTGERFVFYYSLQSGYDFTVSELGFDDEPNSFTITDDGTADSVHIFYLYDETLIPNPELLLFTEPIITTHELKDAVQIDLKDEAGGVIGRIWLFDVGSVIYQTSSPSGIRKAVVENGGVISTSGGGSGNVENQPKYWLSNLLDGNRMFTMRILQIESNNGVVGLGGSGSIDMKFSMKSNGSTIRENRMPIYGDFKMLIYGDGAAVSAWRFFYTYYVGFEGEVASEDPLYISDNDISMFSLNHAICNLGMEVIIS